MQGVIEDTIRIDGEINSSGILSGQLIVQNDLSGVLADSVIIGGDLSDSNVVMSAEMASEATLNADMSLPIYVERPEYEGAYTVIPSASVQTLDTMGFVMQDDVTVTEIPYAEVSNLYGTTISIVS